MLDSQALEALAAICGSAAPTPMSGPAKSGASTSSSSNALIAHQMQEARTNAAAAVSSKHQHQALGHSQARRSTQASVAPNVMQTHLSTAAATSTCSSRANLNGSLATLAGMLANPRCPDPNDDGRVFAANFFLAQHHLHGKLPQISSSTPLSRFPQAAVAPGKVCSADDAHAFKVDPQPQHKAKRPPKKRHVKSKIETGMKNDTIEAVTTEWDDKKEAKRAANRLSAHLSRKRKKMFVEELKDENQDLRRKEQILQAIPDLIIVFDSSGCMPFVSHSVSSFLDYTSDELQGSSFWDRLTEESVRSIKSAFMDSLAVKLPGKGATMPLWNGKSMAITLVNKGGYDGRGIPVSMKGVVHFSGESPECVCSIRREEDFFHVVAATSGTKKGNPASATAPGMSSIPHVPTNAAAGTQTHPISDVDSERGNLV